MIQSSSVEPHQRPFPLQFGYTQAKKQKNYEYLHTVLKS